MEWKSVVENVSLYHNTKKAKVRISLEISNLSFYEYVLMYAFNYKPYSQ